MLAQVVLHPFYHLMTYQRLAKNAAKGARTSSRITTAPTGSRFPFCCRRARHSAARRGATRLRSMATRERSHRTPDACSRRAELPKELKEALAALAAHRVVALFSRLHPLIPQRGMLAGPRPLRSVQEIVAKLPGPIQATTMALRCPGITLVTSIRNRTSG